MTVLSPHRDDAAFSLFLWLCRWSLLPVKLKVINFFTRSGYAPHADSDDVPSITAIREAEDERVFSLISTSIEVIDGGLLDAPLRVDIAVPDVFKPESRSLVKEDQIDQVTRFMQPAAASDLYLAPLGLGGHLDHWLVHEAARRTLPHESLGFYEDLPYAIWASAEQLQSKIGIDLQRFVLCDTSSCATSSVQSKRGAVGEYKSQITPTEADAIANSGEGIWIPQKSRLWNELIT
ncbi:MAG: hypothetical protein M3Y72_22005 [Acidobacteriota bacterium]|nr:hypothetical protein [Acidobacteriota bacterium]